MKYVHQNNTQISFYSADINLKHVDYDS